MQGWRAPRARTERKDLMTVTIKLFAWLAERTGVNDCRVTLPPGASIADARAALTERYPELEPWLASVRPAVNLAYGAWDAALRDGDELALIPPVSGG